MIHKISLYKNILLDKGFILTCVYIFNKVLDKCFGRLFAGCSKLSMITYYCNKLGEDSNTGINHTYQWVEGVSPTGTWYNANQQKFTNMSNSEIPNGWKITDYYLVTNPEK